VASLINEIVLKVAETLEGTRVAASTLLRSSAERVVRSISRHFPKRLDDKDRDLNISTRTVGNRPVDVQSG